MLRLLALLLSPGIARAVPSFIADDAICTFSTGRLSAECVPRFLAHVLSIIFSFTGGICVIMIMISGYQIAIGKLVGSGDDAGKSRLKFAILGFIVSALCVAIIQFVIATVAL